MIKKVYELIGMDACRINTTYCGVKVNMEFRNGNHMNGKRATLITVNPFVQDAIERDPRYGKMFKLANSYELPDNPENPVIDEEENPRRRGLRGRRNAVTAVEEVRSVNDVIEYFAKKGEKVDGDAMIEELKAKYNVEFPNLRK